MSSTGSMIGAINTTGVSSLWPVDSAAKPVTDGLYATYNAAYGESDKELPLAVKEYLLQVKAYSDALSNAVVSLMQQTEEAFAQEWLNDGRAGRESGGAERESGGPERESGAMAAVSTERESGAMAAVSTERMDTNARQAQAPARVREAVERLVSSYNRLLGFADDLQKEPGFLKLSNRLSALGAAYGDELGQVGIAVADDGRLKLDEKRLDAAIADGRVAGVFAGDKDERGFARGVSAAADKAAAEPYAYMDDEPQHRAGGGRAARGLLRLMDSYKARGMIFDTTQ